MDKRLNIMRDTRKAHAAYERAQKAALAATKKALPIGTVLHVNISHGVWIEFEVTAHATCWWSDPCMVHGINLNTGKHRKFLAGANTYPFSVIREASHG